MGSRFSWFHGASPRTDGSSRGNLRMIPKYATPGRPKISPTVNNMPPNISIAGKNRLEFDHAHAPAKNIPPRIPPHTIRASTAHDNAWSSFRFHSARSLFFYFWSRSPVLTVVVPELLEVDFSTRSGANVNVAVLFVALTPPAKRPITGT